MIVVKALRAANSQIKYSSFFSRIAMIVFELSLKIEEFCQYYCINYKTGQSCLDDDS